jgi:hypothetical protein
MAAEHKLNLTVVVSGSPERISINDRNTVADLMRKSLHKAKIPNEDLAGWSLRFAEGGEAIPPQEKIANTGIIDGATLFLNRDAGGGGQVAVSASDEAPPAVLVDPEISKRKLDRELEDWDDNQEIYEKRGWILLGHEGLNVDIAFSARLPIGPFADVPSIPLAVRLGFQNYDLWPPSVRVIDPITRRWLQVPRVGALDFKVDDGESKPLNLFVLGHPRSGYVFLCKQGVLEYHTHPEHSGDDWLLYRGHGFGTLGALCDLLWRRAVRTVTGVNFIAQRVPIGDNAAVNHVIELRQEDVEELEAQLRGQMQGAPIAGASVELPPEIQAQIQGSLSQATPR